MPAPGGCEHPVQLSCSAGATPWFADISTKPNSILAQNCALGPPRWEMAMAEIAVPRESASWFRMWASCLVQQAPPHYISTKPLPFRARIGAQGPYLHPRLGGANRLQLTELSWMMYSNLKVLMFTLNNFDQRADSAFAQCTCVVEVLEGGKGVASEFKIPFWKKSTRATAIRIRTLHENAHQNRDSFILQIFYWSIGLWFKCLFKIFYNFQMSACYDFRIA